MWVELIVQADINTETKQSVTYWIGIKLNVTKHPIFQAFDISQK